MASIFTKIINREIPAHIIYEDEQVIAFLDIQPSSKGHTLVVSKQEIDEVDELPEELYNHLMATAKQLSRHIKSVYKPMRVGMLVFGTEVPHAHVHLIPLYTGQEMAIVRDSEATVDDSVLAAVAKELEFN